MVSGPVLDPLSTVNAFWPCDLQAEERSTQYFLVYVGLLSHPAAWHGNLI